MNLGDFDNTTCAASLTQPETVPVFSVFIINRTPVCYRFHILCAWFDCLFCIGLETHGASVCMCVWCSACVFLRGEHTDAEQIRFHSRRENNLIFLTLLLISRRSRSLLFRIPSCSSFCNQEFKLNGTTVIYVEQKLWSRFVFNVSNRKWGWTLTSYKYHVLIHGSDGDDVILGWGDNNVRMKGVYFVKVQPVWYTNCVACFLSSALSRSILQSMISVSVESTPLGAAGQAWSLKRIHQRPWQGAPFSASHRSACSPLPGHVFVFFSHFYSFSMAFVVFWEIARFLKKTFLFFFCQSFYSTGPFVSNAYCSAFWQHNMTMCV